MKDERRHFFRKLYLSLYWKGCVWEGVGDRTELQHIDPHSSGYHSLSFPLSWAAQPGPGVQPLWDMVLFPASSFQLLNRESWGPPLLVAGSLYCILSPTNWTSCCRGYMIIWCPLFFLQVSQFRTQFNPSTVKVTPDLLISLTGCTCYSHRCISSFDSLAGSDVNIQHQSAITSTFRQIPLGKVQTPLPSQLRVK